jgi:hypothetical protein
LATARAVLDEEGGGAAVGSVAQLLGWREHPRNASAISAAER